MAKSILSKTHILEMLRNTKHFEQCFKTVNITTLENGRCTAELKIGKEHTNQMGGLHGGLSATLVDCISTYALMSLEKGAFPNVSVDIHMTYLKSAMIGDDILVEACASRVGKTLAFLDVLIKNKDSGDILVKGSHTKYLMQPR